MRTNDDFPALRRAASALFQLLLASAAMLAHGDALPQGADEPLERIVASAEALVRDSLPAAAPSAAAADAHVTRYFISAAAPDPRLQLARCARPLQAALVPAAQVRDRNMVQVRCTAPVAWMVQLIVTVGSEADVLVTRSPLARGAQPAQADFSIERRRLAGPPGDRIGSLAQLHGLRLRRSIAAGTVLTSDALEPQPVVRRGETVTLVAESAGFEVRESGRALSDAAPGDVVRIQNVNSLKIVEGRADEAGIVRIHR
jgi:flagella basal body P-ring formation protein FlgA